MQTAAKARFEPLTLGMLLDRTVRIYLDNFSLMAGISVIAHIPYLAVILAIAVGGPALIGADPSGGQLAVIIAGAVVGVLALVIWGLVVVPLAAAATTKAVSERYLGNEISIGSAFGAAWNVLGRLLVSQFVAGLIVVGGMLLLVVPGILWALSYSLIAPVVVLEALSASDSRVRSWNLVAGNRGRIFLFMILMAIIGGVISSGVTMIFTLAGKSVATTVASELASAVVQVLLQPISAIAMTLFYYDLRVRKEGFDLDILRQMLEART